MNKKLLFINIVLLAFILNSCGAFQKPAVGPEDQIILVADSSDYVVLKSVLDSTFEKIIYTPQPEKLFYFRRIPVGQFSNYQNRKNILIVAPLYSESSTSKYLQSVIDTAVKREVMHDSVAVITKYNLWARDQLVMVLTAPTMKKLELDIAKNSDNLLYLFQKISDKRLYETLYSSEFERKNIEGEFLKDYGWVIYVQADYKVAINDSLNHFVWLRRAPNSSMERWIFVYWINNASPAYLNADSIRAIRNRLTKKYYRTYNDSSYVEIAHYYYTTHEINFKGRYAILTQGLWQLNTFDMGGPFINYTFYDQKTHRIYMLDGSIYAPRYFKRKLIQQMDVTLQSFMTAKQLSKSRTKELLDAVKDPK